MLGLAAEAMIDSVEGNAIGRCRLILRAKADCWVAFLFFFFLCFLEGGGRIGN